MSEVRSDTAARSEAPASSRALRLYVAVVIVVGGVALAKSIGALVAAPPQWQWILFAACGILTGSFTINIVSVSASISVADTFFIAAAMLFGPGAAAVAMAADTGILSFRKGHRWDRIAFNTAGPALSIWIAGRVFFLLAGVEPLSRSGAPPATVIGPLFCLAVVYFLLNSGLTAVAIGLDARRAPLTIWRQHFFWLSIGYLAAASIAFCFILLSQKVSPVAIVIVLPILGVLHLTLRSSFGRLEDAQRHLGDLDRLYLSTVETLAMAIDAKDDVTHSHVRRVQAYAVGLARALGINDELTIKAIEAAALLHDTGKLAVPEHILNKPGKLTESEFDKMKLHVDVGADILSLVEFPYPVVPIVRCHHENWNGTGYPRGVTGEEIPIGARILSVVDCFDALTSDRPYRRAMSESAAFDILRERRGTMYDPRVVDMFIGVCAAIRVDRAETAEQRDVMRRIGQSRQEPVSAPDAAAPSAAASNDVLAFVSLSRLAAGDGSVADVLALSSTLIRDIMPDVTGAWYLPDGTRDRLTAAETFGPSAAALKGVSVGMGQRLTGWVAASRQSIVNSDAALDLDGHVQIDTPLRSCLSVPLLNGESLAGVLSLYAGGADAFDENRGRLIEMIAPHVAASVQAAARTAPTAKASGRELRLVSNR
jgi:putative nucleotidyltransferase with HDIG domain